MTAPIDERSEFGRPMGNAGGTCGFDRPSVAERIG
jgi:hypothetical protein